MNAQEILDALQKAQNESNLDQVAVWALSRYLKWIWKDEPERNIRPFNLGKAMSDFFVDLSQHRLPEKITKQTPQTEAHLMDFFGTSKGGLSKFWAQCLEIWKVTLKPFPDYAEDVKKYFDMLLASSLQGGRLDFPISSAQPASPTDTEIPEKVADAPVTVSKSIEIVPESPVEPPTPAVVEPQDATKEPATSGEDASKDISLEKPVPPPISPKPSEPKTFPRNAYLVLQGTRVIPLNLPFIKIGRQLDNHIILEDPRVSRSHAQIKLVNDRFVIFDMNSTGGTFVNGKRISQSVMYAGDVISLAGVVFIYSQELPAKPGTIKVIELGSPFAADRPTAVMRKEEARQVKRTGDTNMPELPKTGPLKK